MSKPISSIVALSLIVNDHYQGIYQDVVKTWIDEFTQEIPCEDEEVNFPFKLPTVGLKEYRIGEAPAYRSLMAEETNIRLKKFADGVRISVLDWENPLKQAILMDDVKRLSVAASQLPFDRGLKSLIEGDTNPYYTVHTGEQFFSAAHSIGGYTYSNLDTTIGALTADAYFAIKTKMRQIPWGPNGKPLPMKGAKWYVIIPPQLEKIARQIFNVTHVYEENIYSENILINDAQIIVDEEFSDANDWYVAFTLPGVKPLVHLKHKTLSARNVLAQIKEEDPAVRDHDEYRWSVKTFEEVFPALFFMFTKVKV